MSLYRGKTFSAFAHGEQINHLICERCRTPYAYRIVRNFRGTGTSPYFMFQTAARNRAQDSAEHKVAKALKNEVEVVPCPKCQWVSTALLNTFRDDACRHFRRKLWIIPGVIFVLLPLIYVLTLADEESAIIAITGWTLLVVGLTSPLWIFAAGRIVRQSITSEHLPPGTPQALLEVRNQQKTDPPIFRPVVNGTRKEVSHSPWAVLRVAPEHIPDLCCSCLAPTTNICITPSTTNRNLPILDIKICSRCEDDRRLSWWRWFVGLILATTPLLAFLGWILLQIRENRPLGLLIAIAILAITSLFFVATWMVQPYHLRWVSMRRGVFKFKARDPRYTQLIAGLAHEPDFVCLQQPEVEMTVHEDG